MYNKKSTKRYFVHWKIVMMNFVHSEPVKKNP